MQATWLIRARCGLEHSLFKCIENPGPPLRTIPPFSHMRVPQLLQQDRKPGDCKRRCLSSANPEGLKSGMSPTGLKSRCWQGHSFWRSQGRIDLFEFFQLHWAACFPFLGCPSSSHFSLCLHSSVISFPSLSLSQGRTLVMTPGPLGNPGSPLSQGSSSHLPSPFCHGREHTVQVRMWLSWGRFGGVFFC